MSRAPESNLSNLLKSSRHTLIERWSEGVKTLIATDPLSRTELLDGMPGFVDELITILDFDLVAMAAASQGAQEHGSQRLRIGFDIGQVVREYGLLEQCLLALAGERDILISPRDQALVARWLNTGIAHAVTQYQAESEAEQSRQAVEHLAFIAHEVRNPLSAVRMAFQRLRGHELLEGGRAVQVLERNLLRTAEVIDNALINSSFQLGIVARLEPLPLQALLEEIERDASVEAQNKAIEVVILVEDALVVKADARLLGSALSNLLRNALKFSATGTTVTIRATRRAGLVAIDVIDACGGLPAGKAADLFTPLVQKSRDRSGFGLGLAIAMQAAAAHGGTITVKDLPEKGCSFTLELPG